MRRMLGTRRVGAKATKGRVVDAREYKVGCGVSATCTRGIGWSVSRAEGEMGGVS